MTTFGFLFRLLIASLLFGSIGLAPTLQEGNRIPAPEPVLYPATVFVGTHQPAVEKTEAPRPGFPILLNRMP